MTNWCKWLGIKTKIDWFKFTLKAVFGFSLIAIFFVYILYSYHFPYLTKDNEKWGQFGDFVGGTLNSIFSFCTFLAILYTLHLQREELGLNRHELELSRREMEKSNHESKKQNEIAAIQLESSIRQKNEEYLLQYMQLYNRIESELRHPMYENKIGANLLNSFLGPQTSIGNIIKPDIKDDTIENNGSTISKNLILNYLNCLEYLIYWDAKQFLNETNYGIPLSNHLAFSSTYAPFIRSFCSNETFTYLVKSTVLLKMNIAAQFPNIARFTSKTNIHR